MWVKGEGVVLHSFLDVCESLKLGDWAVYPYLAVI